MLDFSRKLGRQCKGTLWDLILGNMGSRICNLGSWYSCTTCRESWV